VHAEPTSRPEQPERRARTANTRRTQTGRRSRDTSCTPSPHNTRTHAAQPTNANPHSDTHTCDTHYSQETITFQPPQVRQPFPRSPHAGRIRSNNLRRPLSTRALMGAGPDHLPRQRALGGRQLWHLRPCRGKPRHNQQGPCIPRATRLRFRRGETPSRPYVSARPPD